MVGEAGAAWWSDARAVIANPEIDIVIELIGGYGIAKALVLEAIAAGKHVVTANKALLAVHGTEIFEAARAQGVVVAFEAAVAGGIPIIKALREGPHRQPHRLGGRHHQRHHQLHPVGDARQGPGLRRRAEAGPGAGLCRGRPDLRHRGRGRGAQGDHHERHRLRHPGAVRQGACRGHHRAAGGRHPLRRATGLPHQAAGHRTPPGDRHRAAGAPHADPQHAADRQCRRVR
jgi:hypothetical protein